MNNRLFRKGFVLGIIVLFVGAGFIPSMGGTVVENTTSALIGSPGYIQDLIDNASDGDTINIPSGIYYENIIIDKSISLIGEDKNTTFIDGNENGDVIFITADRVNLRGFTIQNSEEPYYHDAGIDIRSNHNTITGNIISNNQNGIFLGDSRCNTIIKNNISNNFEGIYLHSFSDNTIISSNIISNNFGGIKLFETNRNTIKDNIINSNNNDGINLRYSNSNIIKGNTVNSNNGTGIYLDRSSRNIIISNNILHNNEGIFLEGSTSYFSFRAKFLDGSLINIIQKNNFINNDQDAFFQNARMNRWRHNYWNESRTLPKLIYGEIYRIVPSIGLNLFFRSVSIPWIPQIDWFPAKEPYDI